MGKKRKASGAAAKPKGPREYDVKDARLGPINTYRDVMNSEDELVDDNDEILLDDVPKSKKQRVVEENEAFLEPSDDEILDYDRDSESEEEKKPAPKKKGKKGGKAQDVESEEEREGEEEDGADSGWFGSGKKDYYNADKIETENDALEEEQEALRLQKKKLAKMSEEDFIFDEDEWLAPEEEKDTEAATEVLDDIEIPDDMSSEERLRLLQARYPELDYLADELLDLQPRLETLQKEAEGQPAKSLPVVKYRILGSYVATLAMYFATLTSPARDGSGPGKPLDPSELRDHGVMGTLLECREAWQMVKDMKTSKAPEPAAALPSPPQENVSSIQDTEVITKPVSKSKKDKAEKKQSQRAEKRNAEIEDSFADLDSLMKNAKKSKRITKTEAPADDNSDFGEEETLDARAAADKAARKKSLRFYTSQIVQKANKRAGAGRDAGGDMDIPYRERLRDRQARLNAEAEKRGKKNASQGDDLGGDDSNDEDQHVATAVRDNEDEYYDMVAAKASSKKEGKAARAEAQAQASALDRVVEQEEVGADGKRKITYAIEKNKGLAPRRKKEVRNPRVKKRNKYADKQKKLKSMKPVFKKGGEGKGGYQGELTGIKPGLIKSVKL